VVEYIRRTPLMAFDPACGVRCFVHALQREPVLCWGGELQPASPRSGMIYNQEISH
jgi:hypothetical protein